MFVIKATTTLGKYYWREPGDGKVWITGRQWATTFKTFKEAEAKLLKLCEDIDPKTLLTIEKH
jgi:hypothetical protein